jgi:hypothetical protein
MITHSKLEIKAERLLSINRRPKAHHAALSGEQIRAMKLRYRTVRRVQLCKMLAWLAFESFSLLSMAAFAGLLAWQVLRTFNK